MKKRLFTPGPTPVPESVLLRMAEPIIHHRNPEFGAVMERVNANLQYLFQTESPVVTLTCSGTGGVEATFVSLFSPGDKIIAVNNGKFGERWVKMPAALGLSVAEIKIPWGASAHPDQILDALKANPDAKGVYIVHSETSTGAATDVREIARIIREHSSALIVIDGITAIGALEFRLDQWGIDACVTGSQKGLMIPPGLAFVALGRRAREAMAKATMPRYYLSLQKALDSHRKNDTPWTPAVSLVVGVDAALQMLREEGIENVWARHERLARALRAGVAAIGLKLFAEQPSNAVTAVWVPEGADWKQFNRHLKLNNGITIAGGQDEFTGRVFRVSHLGYYDDLDMVTVMSALERSFLKQGFRLSAGSGVAAVHNSLLESMA